MGVRACFLWGIFCDWWVSGCAFWGIFYDWWVSGRALCGVFSMIGGCLGVLSVGYFL